jgi:DnaJ-class molecular chaperone
MRIRSAGNGEPGTNGGPPGDLFIEIRLKKHAIFERDGDDLHCVVPVSIARAALGGEIDVPTLDGKAAIDIPEGTQAGKQFRLRGKGIKGVRSSVAGDLYCHIAVEDAGQADRAPAQAAQGAGRVAEEGRRQALAQRGVLADKLKGLLQLSTTKRSGADHVLPARRPKAASERLSSAPGSGRGTVSLLCTPWPTCAPRSAKRCAPRQWSMASAVPTTGYSPS